MSTSIYGMGGDDVGTSVLERFSRYVTEAAFAAGYDVTKGRRTGDRKRLAQDAGIDQGSLSRLLDGERMLATEHYPRLAAALRVTLVEMLIESGIYPAESLTQDPHKSVSSRSLTPDDVADAWGITDPAGREMVWGMYERLHRRPPGTENDPPRSAEAQG